MFHAFNVHVCYMWVPCLCPIDADYCRLQPLRSQLLEDANLPLPPTVYGAARTERSKRAQTTYGQTQTTSTAGWLSLSAPSARLWTHQLGGTQHVPWLRWSGIHQTGGNLAPPTTAPPHQLSRRRQLTACRRHQHVLCPPLARLLRPPPPWRSPRRCRQTSCPSTPICLELHRTCWGR